VKDVLVREVAADATPIERVYREQSGRLWRAVFAYAGDREIANDAVAEAFMQAIRRGPGLRAPERWVWRVAFRVAAGQLKERRRTVGEADAPYEMGEPVLDVLRALARLSPRQRAAIVLHHYAGYPVREVASILGSTPPAVRVHLSVGRKRLRELLAASDG
jgi:RNA polymerase sigma-70 factor (ECF subfamily)